MSLENAFKALEDYCGSERVCNISYEASRYYVTIYRGNPPCEFLSRISAPVLIDGICMALAEASKLLSSEWDLTHNLE